MVLQFFENVFRFPDNLFQSESIENVQGFHWLSHKNLPISQREDYYKSLVTVLEEAMSFLLVLKTSKKKSFGVLKQKPTQILP